MLKNHDGFQNGVHQSFYSLGLYFKVLAVVLWGGGGYFVLRTGQISLLKFL